MAFSFTDKLERKLKLTPCRTVSLRLVILFPLVLLFQEALAQGEVQQQDQSRWWVNISINNTGEVGLNLRKNLLWVARSSYVGGLGTPGQTGGGSPSWDVGLLIGDEWKNDWGSASIAAGGAMTVVKTEYTVGIPFETHVVATPLSFVGVGIGFFGNLNTKETFYQLAITLRFGSL